MIDSYVIFVCRLICFGTNTISWDFKNSLFARCLCVPIFGQLKISYLNAAKSALSFLLEKLQLIEMKRKLLAQLVRQHPTNVNFSTKHFNRYDGCGSHIDGCYWSTQTTNVRWKFWKVRHSMWPRASETSRKHANSRLCYYIFLKFLFCNENRVWQKNDSVECDLRRVPQRSLLYAFFTLQIFANERTKESKAVNLLWALWMWLGDPTRAILLIGTKSWLWFMDFYRVSAFMLVETLGFSLKNYPKFHLFSHCDACHRCKIVSIYFLIEN